MKKSVDHHARRESIAKRSVALFSRVGYKDVTLQMVAEHCGVARTVLYRYFTDKRQIFDAAILYEYSEVMKRFAKIIPDESMSVPERLNMMCSILVAAFFDKREFLAAVIDFLSLMKRAGNDMSRPIRMYTIGLIRRLHSMVVDGITRGEIREDVNVDLVTDLLYANFESVVTRITLSDDAEMAEIISRIDQLVNLIKVKK